MSLTSSSRPSTSWSSRSTRRCAPSSRRNRRPSRSPVCWRNRAPPTRRYARVLPDRAQSNCARSRSRAAERGTRIVARARPCARVDVHRIVERDFRAHSPDRELERQLAQETSQRRTLSENRHSLQDLLNSAEKPIVEIEGKLAAAREKLALLEDEKRAHCKWRSIRGSARSRPPHPPPDREREHADRGRRTRVRFAAAERSGGAARSTLRRGAPLAPVAEEGPAPKSRKSEAQARPASKA